MARIPYKQWRTNVILTKQCSQDTRIIPCSNCGKLIRVTAHYWKIRGRKNSYCDKKCEREHRFFGENLELRGGHLNRYGYRVIRVNGKPVFKHRIIMSRKLGRELKKTEHVHHINGLKDDNREENLMVVDVKNHPSETRKIIRKLQERIRLLEREKLLNGK